MARLFHSLVVLGAGVSASGCGGVTSIGTGGKLDNGAGTGGTSGASGSSSGTGGGGLAIGGASGSGGLVQGGGTGGVPTLDAGTIPALPDAGTLAQWNCGSGLLLGCAPFNGSIERFWLNEACPVDPTRPRSATECGSDEWFQCRAALWVGQTPIAVACECTPMLDGGCGTCDPVNFTRLPAVCDGHTKLCGCAFTGITH